MAGLLCHLSDDYGFFFFCSHSGRLPCSTGSGANWSTSSYGLFWVEVSNLISALLIVCVLPSFGRQQL